MSTKILICTLDSAYEKIMTKIEANVWKRDLILSTKLFEVWVCSGRDSLTPLVRRHHSQVSWAAQELVLKVWASQDNGGAGIPPTWSEETIRVHSWFKTFQGYFRKIHSLGIIPGQCK